MKTLYRQGLKNRYSALMQIISGVHYNFSLPLSFWQEWADVKDAESGKDHLGGLSAPDSQLLSLRLGDSLPVWRFASHLLFLPAGTEVSCRSKPTAKEHCGCRMPRRCA